MNTTAQDGELAADGWCGDATSVVELLRPLRQQLDAPDVLEVCLNRPGVLLVETTRGWRTVAAPDMAQERCLSLARAVATFCDQQINQERPLLSATLPSGERIQFVIPPAVARDTSRSPCASRRSSSRASRTLSAKGCLSAWPA